MPDGDYITKKDLADVTQKVMIVNNEEGAIDKLVDEQKKNDLKQLEENIEQKSLFQDIADGINGLSTSLVDGLSSALKSLIPKTDGGLSKLLGIGFGLLLAPFVTFFAFIGQLGVELNFLTRGGFGKLIDKMFKPIRDFFKNNKFISKIFAGKGGAFSKIFNVFKRIADFVNSGPFKSIMKVASSIGRVLGKIFLPITILFGVIDFVKGFMKGYEEGGIIEGIKQGIMEVFDGLVGGLLRILAWIPTKLAEWLGLDNIAEEIGKQTEVIIQSVKDVFGGLVDLVVGIFTWDTDKMMGGLQKIWDGIVGAVMIPFNMLGALIKDTFGADTLDKIKITLKKIGLSITSFFLFLQQGITGLLKKVPKILLPESAENFIDDLDAQTNAAKRRVDLELKSIKKLEEGLEATRGINEFGGSGNRPAGPANVSSTNTTINAPNNTQYNVIGESGLRSKTIAGVYGGGYWQG